MFSDGQAFQQGEPDCADVENQRVGVAPKGLNSLLAGHGPRDADGNTAPADIEVLPPVPGYSLPHDRVLFFAKIQPAPHPVAENEGVGLRGVDRGVLPVQTNSTFAAVGLDGQVPAVHGDGHLVDVVDGFQAEGTAGEGNALTLEGVDKGLLDQHVAVLLDVDEDIDGLHAGGAVLSVGRWGGEGAEQGEGDEGWYVQEQTAHGEPVLCGHFSRRGSLVSMSSQMCRVSQHYSRRSDLRRFPISRAKPQGSRNCAKFIRRGNPILHRTELAGKTPLQSPSFPCGSGSGSKEHGRPRYTGCPTSRGSAPSGHSAGLPPPFLLFGSRPLEAGNNAGFDAPAVVLPGNEQPLGAVSQGLLVCPAFAGWEVTQRVSLS